MGDEAFGAQFTYVNARLTSEPMTWAGNQHQLIAHERSCFQIGVVGQNHGVTTVHVIPGNNCVVGGVSRVVRPIGLSVDEMTVEPDVALKFSTSPKGGFDRMTQMATLRETFAELDDYLGRLSETNVRCGFILAASRIP